MGREKGSRVKIRDKNEGEEERARHDLMLTDDALSTILPFAGKEFDRVVLDRVVLD